MKQPAGTYRLEVDFPSGERTEVARLLGILRREWPEERTEDIVLRALREAAERT